MKATALNLPVPVSRPARCPYHVVRDAVLNVLRRLGFHRSLGNQPSRPTRSPATRCPFLAGRGAGGPPRREVPGLAGDPEANAILEDARSRLYRWPLEFAGFAAHIHYHDQDGTVEGRLQVRSSSDMTLVLPDRPSVGWIRTQLHELVSHREHPSRNGMTNHGGVVFGEMEDPVTGICLRFVSDKMRSFYRIKDGRITQIGRSYPESRFVVSLFDHHDFGGRYCARTYSVTYWDKETGHLRKTETFVDEYLQVDGMWLPSRRTHLECGDKPVLRVLELASHRTL